MALFRCRTRNNEDPDGKTKAYISYTEDVPAEIIEDISVRLTENEDYAVYMADLDVSVDDAFVSEFREMDKVVFFLSPSMFEGWNRALFMDLPMAMIWQKDLLPVDDGTGSIDLFLTCCEHIPEDWSVERSYPLILRTLLLSHAEMAGAMQLKKDYKAAEKLLLKARGFASEITRIAKDAMSLDDESICLMNIGINRAMMEDWSEAYTWVREALDKTEELIAFSRDLNAMKRKCYAYRILGEVSRSAKDDEKAMEWYDAAVFYSKAILEEFNDRDTLEMLPLCLIRLAEGNEKDGRTIDASALYREALDLYRDMEEKELAPKWLLREMCSSAMRAFQLFLEQDDRENAERYQGYAGHLMTLLTAEKADKDELPKPETIRF